MLDFLKSLAIFKNLTGADLAKASMLAIISIPVALLYAFWKMNQQPKQIPVTIEEAYPDEHLGI